MATIGGKQETKLTYDNYLKISSGILASQEPKSDVPEEMLFIITHQAFELWFKVINGDLVRICNYFETPGSNKSRQDETMLSIVSCFDRTCKILKVVVQHFEILETMSPMTFLEFRDELGDGSGFQSVQFREIENKLGLTDDEREKIGGQDYKDKFDLDEKAHLTKSEADEKTLRKVLEKWLTEHLQEHDKAGSFWSKFKDGWEAWREKSSSVIPFESVEKDLKNRKTSFDALKGALFVSLYRDEPYNHLLYQIISYVKDIEALIMRWRTSHVMMVHRMIGKKPGTGGSTGVDYLLNTVKNPKYRTFEDFYDTASYLVPKQFLPAL